MNLCTWFGLERSTHENEFLRKCDHPVGVTECPIRGDPINTCPLGGVSAG
jgi:hypothetical protein